ncbi:non-ribosomal peptide synthetase [Bacillus cereus]|uniref:non-ribosomal peptide synthetase n=1 Tax=Bacillus cereus TaxID=1396 RepID=UPI003D00B88C
MEKLLSQQRYILNLQKEDLTQAYLVHYKFLLEGNLNIETLKDSIKEFWSNNHVFNSNNSIFSNVKYYDLSRYNQQDQMDQVNEVSLKAVKGINNDNENIFNSSLIKLSEEKNLLILTYSAIFSDISTQLVMDKISQIYASKLEGSQLSETPISFLQVYDWFKGIENSDERIYSKQYWIDKLIQAENQEIPLIRQKLEKEGHGSRIKKISIPIDKHLLNLIKELVHDKYSVSHYLLAIWTLQLSRLLNSKKITVGYYCEGRIINELKGVIGPISKYVPLSVNVEEEHVKFNEYLDNVCRVVNESKESQIEFQWENLIKQLNEMKEDNYFKYGFDYEEVKLTYMSSDLKMKTQDLYVNISKNDLRISCVNNNETIDLNLYYDHYKISEFHAERVLSEYHSLLMDGIKDISRNCLEIGLKEEVKNELVLSEADYFVHKKFEEQASQFPDNKALVFGNKSLNYRQLNQLANKYAALLKGKGVQKGDVVAISMERNFEYVISILAVIKIGGVYLPIDSKFPLERVKYVIEDAAVNLLLTDRNPDFMGIDVEHIIVSSSLDSIQEDYPDIDYNLGAHDLIYTIYTSGSMGKPKGVLVEHAQLSNYLVGLRKHISIHQGDVCAHLSSFATDLGNTVLFTSLCEGGTLHIIPNDILNDPNVLRNYLRNNKVDLYKITPTHLSNLTLDGAHGLLPRKYLILGGEIPKSNLLGEICKSAQCKIFNHYGPTETTVGVFMHEFTKGDSLDELPIGTPLFNVQTYILDSFLRPVPFGFPGELYIGGANVSRGYLKNSDLTAEKFIPNHLSDLPGARLYRTGDLVRYNSNGQVVYIKRIDNQSKIRGYRFEPEEVESYLEERQDIRKAIIVVHDVNEINQRLIAYILPHKQKTIHTDDLQNYLKQRLPEYMVPYTYIVVDQLPILPSGKINKRQLLDMLIEENSDNYIVDVESEIEKKLLSIWKEVLGGVEIGVEDNLFELGGHSLSATQIIIRVRKAFDINIPLRLIFDFPTIKGLAVAIEDTID